jgi:hypothetical protein
VVKLQSRYTEISPAEFTPKLSKKKKKKEKRKKKKEKEKC